MGNDISWSVQGSGSLHEVSQVALDALALGGHRPYAVPTLVTSADDPDVPLSASDDAELVRLVGAGGVAVSLGPSENQVDISTAITGSGWRFNMTVERFVWQTAAGPALVEEVTQLWRRLCELPQVSRGLMQTEYLIDWFCTIDVERGLAEGCLGPLSSWPRFLGLCTFLGPAQLDALPELDGDGRPHAASPFAGGLMVGVATDLHGALVGESASPTVEEAHFDWWYRLGEPFGGHVSMPSMRVDLIGVLETLADDREVRRAWIDHDPESGLLRGGWLPAHLFNEIDDLANLEHPTSMLGVTLKSADEVDLVAELNTSIDLVIAATRTGATDTEIVSLPEWQPMAEAARRLALEMAEPA